MACAAGALAGGVLWLLVPRLREHADMCNVNINYSPAAAPQPRVRPMLSARAIQVQARDSLGSASSLNAPNAELWLWEVEL